MTTSNEIVFSVEGKSGVVTLNRERALNALTVGMVRSLDAQLRAWETDNRVKRIVIEGAGEKAFCAGGDIRQ